MIHRPRTHAALNKKKAFPASSTEIKSILVGGSKETVVSKVEKEGYHLARKFRHQGIILRHATVVGDDNVKVK